MLFFPSVCPFISEGRFILDCLNISCIDLSWILRAIDVPGLFTSSLFATLLYLSLRIMPSTKIDTLVLMHQLAAIAPVFSLPSSSPSAVPLIHVAPYLRICTAP